jgi:hypothetical protein
MIERKSIMLKDLSFEEIQTYFEELNQKENSRFLKAQLYGMAQKQIEQIEKENQIENTYGDDARKHVVNVLIIDDTLSIIKTQEKWNNEPDWMATLRTKLENTQNKRKEKFTMPI